MGKRWTFKDDLYLKAHGATSTVDELASVLGRTRHAVYTRLERIAHVTPKRLSYDRVPEMSAAIRHNLTLMPMSAIAKALGVTRHAVRSKVARMGLKGRRWGWRNEGRDLVSWYGDIRVVWTPEEKARLDTLRVAKAAATANPSFVAHDWLTRRTTCERV